jgi:hypothetical protein
MTTATHDAVRRLIARNDPMLVGLLQAACEWAEIAEKNGSGIFAGSYVLQEWAVRTGGPRWRPGGLRPLSAEGLIVNAAPSTRGGKRAYYQMPDRKGVEAALREFKVQPLPPRP